MGFNSAGLGGPIYFGGALSSNKLWVYNTTDAIGTALGSNYFNDLVAPRNFSVGDLMVVNIWTTAVGTTFSAQYLCYVSGVVPVSDKFPAELNASYDGAATVSQWSNATGITNNYTAAVDPAVAADSSAGYVAGSKWLNTATSEYWTCLSNAAGAAVWEMDDPVVFNFPAVSLLANVTAATCVPGFKFRVQSLNSITTAVNTTLGAATTLTPQIGAAAIAGMGITMATGDVAGATYSVFSSAIASSVGSSAAAINLVVGAHATTTGSAGVTVVVKKTT